jgi:hypothetical protein
MDSKLPLDISHETLTLIMMIRIITKIALIKEIIIISDKNDW